MGYLDLSKIVVSVGSKKKKFVEVQVTPEGKDLSILTCDEQIMELLSLHRRLSEERGMPVKNALPYPVVKLKAWKLWSAFAKLLEVLKESSINPSLYVRAQFEEWHYSYPAAPYPRNYCDAKTGTTPTGISRWESYEAGLKQKFDASGSSALTSNVDPNDLLEAFQNAKYAVDVLLENRQDVTPYQALIRLVKEIHPAYIACQPEFVRSWLPKLDSSFNKVREQVQKISQDAYYRRDVMNARRSVLGW